MSILIFFFFNDTATTEIYTYSHTLSLHDALPISNTAKTQLRKLDKQAARRILDFMDERVAGRDDPRSTGKALTGPLGGLWRYRVGDFRVICDIQDGEIGRAHV